MLVHSPPQEGLIPGQEPPYGSEIPLAGTTAPGIPGLERLSAVALCALPTEERAAAKARSFTRAQLCTWGVGEDVTYEACILVSELVTNALLHSGADGFCVGLARSGRQLCIEVTDNGSGRSPPRLPPTTWRNAAVASPWRTLSPRASGCTAPPPEPAPGRCSRPWTARSQPDLCL
ncbi:ATP-binding protein [Streptomyces nigrescens]